MLNLKAFLPNSKQKAFLPYKYVRTYRIYKSSYTVCIKMIVYGIIKDSIETFKNKKTLIKNLKKKTLNITRNAVRFSNRDNGEGRTEEEKNTRKTLFPFK